MKIFRFDQEVGRQLTHFDSQGATITPIARPEGSVQLGCFYLTPGAVVGFHQATIDQLFLVVQGEGWVRGAEPQRTPIHAGQAAFWEPEEWHESGTETGMTVMVLEASKIDPERYLKTAV